MADLVVAEPSQRSQSVAECSRSTVMRSLGAALCLWRHLLAANLCAARLANELLGRAVTISIPVPEKVQMQIGTVPDGYRADTRLHRSFGGSICVASGGSGRQQDYETLAAQSPIHSRRSACRRCDG
jgi:hypothetical protein